MKTTAYTTEELMDVAGRFASRSGLRDVNDREDCQQDVIVGMLIAAEKADPEGNVQGYQFKTGKGIALNTFNAILDHKHRFVTSLNQTVDVEGDGVDRVDTFSGADMGYVASTIEAERTQAIDKAINSLPERQAAFLKANILDGVTLDAIGKANGISLQRVHEIISEGKAKLASKLAAWEPTLA